MGEDKQSVEKQKVEHVINRNKTAGTFGYSRYSKTPLWYCKLTFL